MTLADIYKILDLHISRADKAAEEISRIQLDVQIFDDFEAVKTIDTFIYRFSKIQDYMGEKLFPFVLNMLGEYKYSMSFMDILNKLERMEFIQSVQQWMDFREIRNVLTHEYPENENEIIEGIILAVNSYTEIKNIYATIKTRL